MVRRWLGILALLSFLVFVSALWLALRGVYVEVQGPAWNGVAPPGVDMCALIWLVDEGGILTLSLVTEVDNGQTWENFVALPLPNIAFLSLVLPIVWFVAAMLRLADALADRRPPRHLRGFEVVPLPSDNN